MLLYMVWTRGQQSGPDDTVVRIPRGLISTLRYSFVIVPQKHRTDGLNESRALMGDLKTIITCNELSVLTNIIDFDKLFSFKRDRQQEDTKMDRWTDRANRANRATV